MKETINYDEIVRNRDVENVAKLHEWVLDATHRAEECGCPNCKKEKQSALKMYYAYIDAVPKNTEKKKPSFEIPPNATPWS